jgi:4-hydroxybenzoate polyprenyltransferase
MRLLKLLDYFFILRPILFFPGWTTTLAGCLAARALTLDLTGPPHWNIVGVCVSSAMLMGAGFLANQMQDTESDRVNQKLFFLSHDFVKRRLVIFETVFLSIASLALAAMISLRIFAIHIPALLLITLLYNFKPFNLKDKPFGSLFANACMGLFALAFGYFLTENSLELFIRKAWPYLFFNTALYFLTTVPDAGGDAHAQKKTAAVVYGIPAAIYAALIFELAALGFGIWADDLIILLPTVFSLPFFIGMAIKKSVSSVILTIKFGLLFFSLTVGIFFPVYLLLIIFFFFATRYYYRKRFQVNYPSLKGE